MANCFDSVEFRFSSLGSGSRGNATVVQITDANQSSVTLLVDCGFGSREIKRRLAKLDITPHDIDAVLITHEHRDHLGGVASAQRQYGWDVYLTPGTARSINNDLSIFTHSKFHLIPADHDFAIGGVKVTAFAVPHDAREPCQYTIEYAGLKFGVLSDLGKITEHVVMNLQDCHALLLECNHDRQMLHSGDYPAMLKRRVGGDYGHLSNDQAAELLWRLCEHKSPLHMLALAHLSEQNNTPDLAQTAVNRALDDWPEPRPTVNLTTQQDGCAWLLVATNPLSDQLPTSCQPIGMETAA